MTEWTEYIPSIRDAKDSGQQVPGIDMRELQEMHVRRMLVPIGNVHAVTYAKKDLRKVPV